MWARSNGLVGLKRPGGQAPFTTASLVYPCGYFHLNLLCFWDFYCHPKCCSKYKMTFERLKRKFYFCLSLDDPQTSLSIVSTGTIFYQRNCLYENCWQRGLWIIQRNREGHNTVEFKCYSSMPWAAQTIFHLHLWCPQIWGVKINYIYTIWAL